MKKHSIFLAFLIAFTLMAVSPLSAAQIFPNDDSYAMSWQPMFAVPNDTILGAGTSSSGTLNSFLQFDLSPYTSAAITSAVLFMRTFNYGPGFPVQVGVYSTTNDWTESTLTWNHQPALTGIPIVTEIRTINTWYTWDVTSLISQTTEGRLSLGVGASNGQALFHSSETVYSPDFRPYLDITQPSSVPVPAAIWLFGTGLLGLIAVKRNSRA